MVSCRVFQSSISGLPRLTICIYCSMPREAASALAPLARKALFNASVRSAAPTRSPVIDAIRCAAPVMSLRAVGKPCTPSDSLRMASSVSSALKPICSIILGKRLSVSYRETASSMEAVIA